MTRGREVDEDFLHSGAKLVHLIVRLRAPADEVWADFSSPTGFSYMPGLKVCWTSPEPFGIGTTRQVSIGGLAKFDERYFIWDDQERRKAFYVERFNLPGFKALAEDYKVVADGTGSVFTWKIVVEPKPHLKMLAFVLRPVANTVLKQVFVKRFGRP